MSTRVGKIDTFWIYNIFDGQISAKFPKFCPFFSSKFLTKLSCTPEEAMEYDVIWHEKKWTRSLIFRVNFGNLISNKDVDFGDLYFNNV